MSLRAPVAIFAGARDRLSCRGPVRVAVVRSTAPWPAPAARFFASSSRSPEKQDRAESDKERSQGVPVENSTDISHATFIASATASSDFNPSQIPSAGLEAHTPPPPSSSSTARIGHLSPTSSHLFKLTIPLPTSLRHPKPPSQPTAFLLHPSQPLSHLSRLIAGSLPPSQRNIEVKYLAVTGKEDDIEDHLRNAASAAAAKKGGLSHSDAVQPLNTDPENELQQREEGGPFLHERDEKRGGRYQEVSWSQSTDLSDFIKQSCLNEKFKIIIKPEETEDVGTNTKDGELKAVEEGLTLEIIIPSFASRTTFLRSRLMTLTKELDRLTKQKKAIDLAAHKGAQKLAVLALTGGAIYWGAVIRITFFTDAGWDLMEPVTWATGFGTLLVSCAFLVYHNREVSYSSLLDLSITARQRRLYDKHGLDVERWTEMVAEAKTLRKEIARIASDYDLEWKGELQNLAKEGKVAPSAQSTDSNASTAPTAPDTTAPTTSGQSKENAKRKNKENKDDDDDDADEREDDDDDKPLDIDKTIDEADELASQSSEQRSKEQAAQRKGEVIDSRGDDDPVPRRRPSSKGGGKKGPTPIERGEDRAKKLAEGM